MCELELDYICTYKMITEEDEDEKGLSELMYKIQYLQLFGLTEFDETVIHQKLESVYKQLEREPFLDELFELHTYKGYMSKEFMFRTGLCSRFQSNDFISVPGGSCPVHTRRFPSSESRHLRESQ